MKLIILAGGSGTRLFPLSQEETPKQFLKLGIPDSLLLATIKRFSRFVSENEIIIVTNEKHARLVKGELAKGGFSKINVLLEPCRRNTLPAICYGIKYIREKLGCLDDEVVFVTPSDHIIPADQGFEHMVATGIHAAGHNHFVTFGIKPKRPETGFGYIHVGEQKDFGYQVIEFIEKPSLERANKFIRSGEYFWNSGMFVFTVGLFENQLAKYKIEVADFFREHSMDLIIKNFQTLANESIDKGIVEKISGVITLPFETDWHDIGTWGSVFDFLQKDPQDNAVIGDCTLYESNHSLFVSSGRPIVALGVDNLIIIETEHTVFVARRDQIDKIREIAKTMQEKS